MTEPPFEPWTPIRCEQEISRLINAVAQAELGMRQAAERELDAKLEYERTHVITTMDPSCPKVERGGYTVAEREDWIRGCESDAYEHYERMKMELKRMQRYQARLEQQCSLVQTMAKLVALSYQVSGSGR